MAGTQPLTIGVLVCDHVDPRLRHLTGGDYDVLFTTFLTDAARAIGVAVDISVFDVIGGELPPTPQTCAAWIVTGSRHDAFADEPWIEDLRAFLRAVIAERGRVTGVCFGHQVVAAALGGTVERTDEWKVGPQRLTLDATPWFDATDLHIHAMHLDAVTALPAGATTIGHGSTATIPAFLVGDNVFCVQDHPEFPAAYVTELIDRRSKRIGSATSEAGLRAVEQQPTDGAALGALFVRFLADQRRT